jgi:hypothetical protein
MGICPQPPISEVIPGNADEEQIVRWIEATGKSLTGLDQTNGTERALEHKWWYEIVRGRWSP